MGDLSEHFSRSEFRCHHCGRIVDPPSSFIAKLEDLRRRIGRALPVVSGYRCEVHNRAVGGKRRSRHLRGDAADFPSGLVTVDQARSSGLRGIGLCNGWVVHVDNRWAPRAVTFADCPKGR